MLSEFEGLAKVKVQGARIRALRTQQQRTLDDAARQAGISKTFLSQIERGVARPSLAVLHRIAEALGIELKYLLSTFDGQFQTLRYEQLDFFRFRDSPALFASLTREMSRPGLDVMLVRFPPGQPVDEIPVVAGEALVFVISGQISLVLDQEPFVMHAGDSLHYRFAQSHGWSNDQPGEALVLWAGVPRLI